MRLNVRDIQRCRNIRIVAGRRLDSGRGGHRLLVVIILVDIVDGDWDVVARLDVPLRPDVVVGEGRDTFERETGHGIVNMR